MTAVFIFCHQDDEFGVFHEIAKAVENKQSIAIFYLTDGAYQGASAPLRNAESLAVLSQLGVKREQVCFVGEQCGIANQQLHMHLSEAYRAVAVQLSAMPHIDRIYSLAWEGGHPDHDAAFILALRLAQERGATLYQFPLYNAYNARLLPFAFMRPVAENGQIQYLPVPVGRWLRYVRYFCAYPSQWKTWLVLLPFFVWHHAMGKGQILQHSPAEVVLRRPHAGPLLYEKRGWMTFEVFYSAVRPFVAEFNRPPI